MNTHIYHETDIQFRQYSPGQSKEKFLQNEWAKCYRRKYTSYRAYREAMEPHAVLNEETQTYKFIMKRIRVTPTDKLTEALKA